jgi:hypothetical protein
MQRRESALYTLSTPKKRFPAIMVDPVHPKRMNEGPATM